eukprot:7352224-Pyramimonas_sp.AAC.1
MLSKAVEMASRKERVLQADVEQRRQAVVRARDVLFNAESKHAEKETELQEAADSLRRANHEKDNFNADAYRLELQ